jgi:hypothetical protein
MSSHVRTKATRPGPVWPVRYGIGSSTPLPTNGLLANAQTLQNCFVTFRVRIAKVGQKPTTLSNQSQQPFPGAVVLLMRLEMLRQQRNPRAQQSNLYFWRPGIGFVALIVSKNLPLCFNRQCHSRGNTPCLLLISFWYVIQNNTMAGGLGRGFQLKHLETKHLIRPRRAQCVLPRIEFPVYFNLVNSVGA